MQCVLSLLQNAPTVVSIRPAHQLWVLGGQCPPRCSKGDTTALRKMCLLKTSQKPLHWLSAFFINIVSIPAFKEKRWKGFPPDRGLNFIHPMLSGPHHKICLPSPLLYACCVVKIVPSGLKFLFLELDTNYKGVFSLWNQSRCVFVIGVPFKLSLQWKALFKKLPSVLPEFSWLSASYLVAEKDALGDISMWLSPDICRHRGDTHSV